MAHKHTHGHSHHHHHPEPDEELNRLDEQLDAAGKSMADALRISFAILKVIMIVLVVAFLASGFKTVGPDEKALVLRFGKIRGVSDDRVRESGLVWSWPYPIGEVVKIDKPVTAEAEAPLKDPLHKVTFKVEFSWKGAGFREVGLLDFVVLSDQGKGGDCFSWGRFVEGEKYLVYADETPNKDLVVQLGNRTALLSNASADLKELRRLDIALLFLLYHH